MPILNEEVTREQAIVIWMLEGDVRQEVAEMFVKAWYDNGRKTLNDLHGDIAQVKAVGVRFAVSGLKVS